MQSLLNLKVCLYCSVVIKQVIEENKLWRKKKEANVVFRNTGFATCPFNYQTKSIEEEKTH